MKRLRMLKNSWRWIFAAVIAALLVTGAVSFVQLGEVAAARDVVQRASGIIHDVDVVVARVRDVEASQRGYLLTQDMAFLASVESEFGEISTALAELRAASAADAARAERAAVFESRVEAKISEVREGLMAAQSGRGAEVVAAIRTGEHRRRTRAMREAADAIREAEESALAARSRDLDDARAMSYIVLGGSLAAAAILLLIAVGVSRQLARGRSALLGVLTERDEAAAAERLAYERLRIALQRSPVTVFTMDKERRYTWLYNPTGEVDPEKVIGHREEEFLDPEDAAVAIALKEEVLRTGESTQRTLTLKLGGVPRTFDYAVEPLRDEKGEIDGLAVAVIETTAIIDAERRRRETEHLSRQLRDASGDCIKVLDREGTVLEINAAGLRLMEVNDPAELVGRSYAGIWGEQAAPAMAAIEQAAAEGEGRFQARCPTAKGRMRWWDVVVTALGNGEGESAGRLLVISRDITELMEAQQALRERDTQLGIVFSQLSAGLVQADRDGRITLVNDRFCEMVGRPREELLGKTAADVTHPDDIERQRELTRLCIENGAPFGFDKRYVRPDGSVLWSRNSVNAVRDGSGRVLSVVAVAQDITAQRAGEERMRESEERFRSLADSMPQIVWATRPDGYVDYFNSRWYDYTGMLASVPLDPVGLQDVGDSWTAYIHPDDIERTRRTWGESVRSGEPYNIEYRIRSASGEYRWFMGRGIAVRGDDGEVVRWFGTCTDIDDKKRDEQALNLLKAAVESANDAVIITEALLDLPGPRVEYVNPAFTWMTGYAADEIIGQTPRVLQGPRTDQTLLRRLRRDLREKQTFHGETINYRKDGTEYVVEWRITPLRDDSGKVTKWVAVQRDVTDRKRIDEERERLLASERVARTEAERTARIKDEFVATLSHELRTPLNAILGWTEIARRRPDDGDTVRKALEVIDRNTRAQAQMVEDLLDMSRVLSGKLRLEVGPVELASVVDSAAASVQPAAEAKGIALNTRIDRFGGVLRGDAARLQQVVWNLLSNAIKFTPAGGRVDVELREEDGHAVVTVTDSGQGMKADFLPHVFERFRQADSSTTRRHGGLGLGLSIVKNLVEMHGGTIAADSDGEGRGSSFTVRIPLSMAAADEPEEARSGRRIRQSDDGDECDDYPELKDMRVLVVDDEPDARELVRHLLEGCSAQVRTAASVSEALSLIDGGVPDVIVSDIGMPEADGYDLIRRIRGLEGSLGGIPAVALTALARPEDRNRALMAGFQTHIAKPIEPSELLATVASLLRGSARREDEAKSADS